MAFFASTARLQERVGEGLPPRPGNRGPRRRRLPTGFAAAGKVSFSPLPEKGTLLETFPAGGVTNKTQVGRQLSFRPGFGDKSW